MTVNMPLSVPLHDVDFYLGDPLPAFARLRREAPVYWDEVGQCWALMKHEDVTSVLRNHDLFISGNGVLRRSPQWDLIMMFLKDTLVLSDPPMHTERRRLITRDLTVRAVARLEPWVRELAQRALDPVEPGVTYDFVHEIAEVLPVSVALDLMGIPRQDHVRLAHLVDQTAGVDMIANAEVLNPMMEVFTYLQQFCIERQRTPRDDLVSAIAHPAEGSPLPLEDVVKYAFLLLAAGTETVRGLLGRGLQALALYPDQKRCLLEDRALLPAAIEEMVRWGSILAYMGRTATRDVTIRGVDVAAGQQVLCYLVSANRDEDVFGDDADDFVIGRQPNPHLGMGCGEHYCAGASLARLEGRVFFDELLTRFSEWELIGQPEPFRNIEHWTAFNKMPVVFHR